MKKRTKPGLVLACGCEVRFRDGVPPTCPRHGSQRVVRALRMPKPRFVGAGRGPLVTTTDMPAFVGPLVGQPPKKG